MPQDKSGRMIFQKKFLQLKLVSGMFSLIFAQRILLWPA